jgi:hypothetical protein
MTLLCMNFLTLILASHFERASNTPAKKQWPGQAASEKGESHHERSKSAE